jgi:mitogen-activated protein kinase kinase
MLIRHPWLAPLLKPPTISEEDEEDESAATPGVAETINIGVGVVSTADKEVAAWVVEAMEKRRLGKMGQGVKPALHQVSLDAVGSPTLEKEANIAAGSES